MAGIEKVCEYSGDYPGYLMYRYKRNHIQICPQYRKLFRGANARIEITQKEARCVHPDGSHTNAKWFDQELERARAWGRREPKLKYDYTFVLVVENKRLRGEVEGKYVNWTFDMPSTYRRLKRMLRVRRITVIDKTVDPVVTFYK